MDIFIEHLVKKKTTVLDVLIRIGLILAALIALTLVFAVPSDSVWSDGSGFCRVRGYFWRMVCVYGSEH